MSQAGAFCRAFKRAYGTTPAAWRRQGGIMIGRGDT